MAKHSWQFFLSSESTWTELLSACEQATTSIDLEQFVFGHPGAIEEQFTQIFLKKAKQGVRVRLLLDMMGSFSFYKSATCGELVRAGVEINYHSVIWWPPLKRVLPFILRDHRKLIVIDEKKAYIGGVIIQERARDWRDTFVSIEGPVVKDMTHAFTVAWSHALKNSPVGQVKSKNEHGEFYIVGNSFHLHDKDLYRTILRAITTAKSHISITTPYFLPTKELLRALYFARKKGVSVTLLFPKCSDNFCADFLSRFFYKTLRKHGIRIYLYKKNILHAKTMVIDGNWATVGSCNFDLLSFWWNYELNLVSTNHDFVAEMEQQFAEDLKESEEVL